MQTTVKIKGMTCGHCEGRVSAELLKISGISDVKASAQDGQVTFESLEAIQEDLINGAVIQAGYSVES